MPEDTPPPHVAAFVEALANEMVTFCGPIFITPGLLTYPADMIDRGTYSLIDTGQRRILVTCCHVLEAYRELRRKDPKTVLGLNLGEGDANIAFASPEDQLIDCDADLDLAVFDFEPSKLKAEGNAVNHQKDWFPISNWPTPPVREGEYLALMGFPGKKIKTEGRECTFVTQALPFRVSGVGRKEIWILNEPENEEVFRDVRQYLGGLSGSPAYTLHDSGANLVGFVKSGFKSDSTEADPDSVFAGTLILTPSTFLQPDGKLSRP